MKNFCQDILRGKRVLVTGDTGFKGSWLAVWLNGLGADVTGYALPPERREDLFNVAGVRRLISHVNGDIRDLSALTAVFRRCRPEFVFHLAAQALVRRSYDDPSGTFSSNVQGSVNVLEAVRISPSVRVLVDVTSDKCYRNLECRRGYREDDELGGRDPYSASKAAAEMAFQSYLVSFFAKNPRLGAASVRAGNVIGGGDWAPDRIIPDCIRALRNHKAIVLRHPEATRPWQHVLEPLSGYIMLAARLRREPSKYSGSWNFGPKPGSGHTVLELAEKIVETWGGGRIEVRKPANALHEAGLLHLNSAKARGVLGWAPRWGFGKTVERTVEWYRRVHDKAPALEMTRNQIADYTARQSRNEKREAKSESSG